jgi:hypothetical protein
VIGRVVAVGYSLRAMTGVGTEIVRVTAGGKTVKAPNVTVGVGTEIVRVSADGYSVRLMVGVGTEIESVVALGYSVLAIVGVGTEIVSVIAAGKTVSGNDPSRYSETVHAHHSSAVPQPKLSGLNVELSIPSLAIPQEASWEPPPPSSMLSSGQLVG